MVTASFFMKNKTRLMVYFGSSIKTEQTIGSGTINMVVKGSPFYSIFSKISKKNANMFYVISFLDPARIKNFQKCLNING